MPEVCADERSGAIVTGPDELRTGLSVLVVEDDPDAGRSYAMLLELLGHRVRVANDGPTALRLAAESTPDVALIDIGLPHMDGCEVAKRLRGQSPDRRPLLVAITGYGQEEDRRRSDAAGIDLHLLKPVEPEKLKEFLRRFEHIIDGAEQPIPPSQEH
jgi:CheY-like chemotaxis protein